MSELEGDGRNGAFLHRGADRTEDNGGMVGLHIGRWPPGVYGHCRVTVRIVTRVLAIGASR
jgi:hypothetical protein